MSLRQTTLAVVCVLWAASLPAVIDAQLSGSVRPNILFIAVDDLRTELGCYGLPHVQSPCLDQLAAESVLFTNHFVQAPTCGASRYALLTGQSPARSNAHSNQSLYQGPTRLSPTQLAAAQTFPELFRRNGYRTICIGKISHTPDGRVFAYDGSGDGRPELPHAWDELATPFGPWHRGWGSFFAYAGGRHREDGLGNRDLMEFVATSDDELPDGMMAAAAIEKLDELAQDNTQSGQPFLLGVGFFKPHLPFVATRGDWEAYAEVDIPPPDHPDQYDSKYWHRSGEFYKYDMSLNKTRPLSADDAVQAKRAYLACVRYVDRQVGRVLDALKRNGLHDNTIVVVWGDHGWHLGESAIWGKHTPFDRALNSSLIIRAPGVSRAGHRCNALVESTDIYPTLVDLCQLETRETFRPLDGASLRDHLAVQVHAPGGAALSYWQDGVTVRTPTHRLIARTRRFHPDPGQRQHPLTDIELYELSDGPDPVDNVAPSQSEVVLDLLEFIPDSMD
ncbi:MAG: sulfatase [Pirellulaceae bacterium]